jgi:hypothetical protein
MAIAKVETIWPKWAFDESGPSYAVRVDGYLLTQRYTTRAAALHDAEQYNWADELNRHDGYSPAS